MSEVAIAMIESDGRWLLQLRDDIEGILYPGQWALFGGHLDPDETPEVALRRELEEEINWAGSDLEPWFELRDDKRIRHFFVGPWLCRLSRSPCWRVKTWCSLSSMSCSQARSGARNASSNVLSPLP